MNNEHEPQGNFWMGFVIGAVVGAVLIFLFGTKEGKKLMKLFEERSELFEEDLEQKITSLQNQGEEFLKKAEDVKAHIIKEVADGKNTISEQMVSRMDDTLTKIEDLQKKGVELTHDVRHNYFKRNGKKLAA